MLKENNQVHETESISDDTVKLSPNWGYGFVKATAK